MNLKCSKIMGRFLRTPMAFICALTGVVSGAVMSINAAHANGLASDISSITQSPVTVNAKRFQLDFELYGLSIFGSEKRNETAKLIAKYGVFDRLDLEATFDGLAYGGGLPRGAANLGLRTKINFIYDDFKAFSLIPYIKFPTSTADVDANIIEFGLLVPFFYRIDNTSSMGFMGGLERVQPGPTRDDLGNSLILSGKWIESLDSDVLAYFESAFSKILRAGFKPTVLLGAGLSRDFTPNTQLFIAGYFGLTPSSPDFKMTFGGSHRF